MVVFFFIAYGFLSASFSSRYFVIAVSTMKVFEMPVCLQWAAIRSGGVSCFSAHIIGAIRTRGSVRAHSCAAGGNMSDLSISNGLYCKHSTRQASAQANCFIVTRPTSCPGASGHNAAFPVSRPDGSPRARGTDGTCRYPIAYRGTYCTW